MKKTVSVNIKGTNFLIEEDAYELLQDYLDRLATALTNDEGSKEIIEDVELRIAEICSSKLSDSKTVIELADIQDILAALGDPADFVDEDEETASKSTSDDESKQSHKENDRRLFRDTDAAAVGGVCAGIANYFAIDVVVARAIFVIFFLFAGFGLPLYIILWVIIPRAESTIDKLRMKGRRVTVESVKREVEDAAQKIKSGSKSFSRRMRSESDYKGRAARGGRVFATVFGIGLLIMGLVNLIGLLIFIISGFQFIPIHGDNGFMSITDFGELILNNADDIGLAWTGGLLVWISFILFLFSLGSLLLFKIKSNWTKFVFMGIGAAGITGIIICSVLGVRTARDFAFDGEVDLEVGRSDQKELVIITRNKDHKRLHKYNELEVNINNGAMHINSSGHFFDLEVQKNRIKSYGIEILYVPTTDTSFLIRQNKSAHGVSRNLADKRSNNIRHGMEMINDTLYIDVDYSFPKADKLRDQDVTVIIEIPIGRTVKLDNRTIHLGSDDSKGSTNHPYYKRKGRIGSDGYYDDYFE